MLEHWETLLLAERLAHDTGPAIDGDGLGELLHAIHWRTSPLVRLLFHVNEAELRCDDIGGLDASPTERLLVQIHERWPDEKGAEDVHQHIRDESRAMRNPSVAPEKIFGAAREAAIPHARGIASLEVPESAFEECRLREVDKSLKAMFRGAPTTWNARLNKLLTPEHTNSSPTLLGEVKSVSAWLWLVEYFKLCSGETCDVPLIAAAVSKLCRERWILEVGGAASVVVSQHDCHCLVWQLRVIYSPPDGHEVQFSLIPMGITVLHLVELDGWRQAPCKGVWHDSIGVVLELTAPFDDLLPAALLQGVKLRDKDMLFFATQLQSGFEWGEEVRNHDDRLDALLQLAFVDRPGDLARAREVYAKPPEDTDTEADDADLVAALDSLGADDPDNFKELQHLAEGMKQRAIKKLQQTLAKFRAAKPKQVKRRGKRKPSAKAKAKAGATTNGHAEGIPPGVKLGKARRRARQKRVGDTTPAVTPACPGGGGAASSFEPKLDVIPVCPDGGGGAGSSADPAPDPPPIPAGALASLPNGPFEPPSDSAPEATPLNLKTPAPRGSSGLKRQAGVRTWATPYLVKQCLPTGWKIFLKTDGSCWRLERASDGLFTTVGFGPRGEHTFAGAADAAIGYAYEKESQPRPAKTRISREELECAVGPDLLEELRRKRARLD